MNKCGESKKSLGGDSEGSQIAIIQDEETDPTSLLLKEKEPIGKILGTWKTSCSMEVVMIHIGMQEVHQDGEEIGSQIRLTTNIEQKKTSKL
jgi:hypothetical protein